MDCKTTAACACSAPGGMDQRNTATRLVVASTTSHTLTAVRRAALATGAEVRHDGGLLEIRTPDRAALLRALDQALTKPEKAEARALDVDEGADTSLVAQALTATSIAVQCARLREQPLGAALRDSGRFSSVYQPIVDLGTGETVAFEALLRGTVDGKPVLPGPMFEAAEEAGWLHVLDRIGREHAIGGAGGWLGDAALFVNFNPTSIYRPEVCLATTELAIRRAGLRMDQLVFEIVESHHIDAMDHLLSVLDHYRSMGCRVAMDDMGSGYASLNSVALIQPEVVKLDKELVQGLPDRAAAAVIRSIVSLSHEIGATVIAECVETAEQVLAARDLGVDWAQGWYFARPSERPRQHPVAALPAGDVAAPAGTPWEHAPSGGQLDVLLRRAVAASRTGITIADARLADMPLVYVNDAFLTLSGRTREEVIGHNCRFLQDEETDADAIAAIRSAIRRSEPVQVRLRNIRGDGSAWWNELSITPVLGPDGSTTHFVGIQQDVTELVAAEAHVAYLATHDPLTGLANRGRLLAHLEGELTRAARTGDTVVLTYLDLDGFKAVNDSHGHAVGDELLAAVASRLAPLVRGDELLARMGGDEFVLVQTARPAAVPAAVARAAADVADAFAVPFEVRGLHLRVSASMGVATSTGTDPVASHLLDAADAAMYTTKVKGAVRS